MDVELTPEESLLLETERRAVLVTLAPDGRPRPVPVCFVASAEPPLRLFLPIDDKPKRAEPTRLARLIDIAREPRVAVLVDRWSEDWSSLSWLRLIGSADVLDPTATDGDTVAERAFAIAALRERYPQYIEHRLEPKPIIRVRVDRATGWRGGEDLAGDRPTSRER